MSFLRTLREIYFDMHGRIGRLAFVRALFFLVVGTIAAAFLAVSGGREPEGAALVFIAAFVLVLGSAFWGVTALLVKRLHDIGLSGLNVVFVYGTMFMIVIFSQSAPEIANLFRLALLAALLILCLRAGDAGPNRFDEVELEEHRPAA